MQLPIHLASGFISVQDRLVDEDRFELALKAFKSPGGQIEIEHDGPARWTRTTQRVHDFCGAFEGQGMGHIQIRRHGVEAWPVLHLTGNVCGEGRLFSVLALRANFNFGLVFRDLKLNVRQVMNLPGQEHLNVYRVPGLSTATLASDWERPDFIRMLTHFEGFSRMTGLCARSAIAFLALTLDPRFVLTGRLAGGLARGGEASFEGHQSQFKLINLSLKDQTIGASSVLDAPTLSNSALQVPLLSRYTLLHNLPLRPSAGAGSPFG